MSELIRLVDEYRASHGMPSEASVARAAGIAPQTLNSWRNRGVRQLPDVATLMGLATALKLDYEAVILPAAMSDIGYAGPGLAARTVDPAKRPGKKVREAQDAVTEPPTDDPDDMEPR